MARNGGLFATIRDRPLDRDAALLGLLLALVLMPLRLLTSQIYVTTLPIVLGAACVLYLYARRHTASAELPRLPRTVGRLLPVAVFFTLGVMSLTAAFQGGRTILFYDLANLAAVLVAGQVLFARDEDLHTGFLLAQVVALAFVVRFAALYTTPGYVGIDVWTHVSYIHEILAQHSLSAIGNRKYYAAPFFHLLVAQTSLLGNVTVRHALWLSAALLMPFSVLLVYPAARTLLSVRYALLAAVLYSVSDQVIRWGIHVIPTSTGLVFFLAILWFLLRILRTGYLVRDFALTLFFSVAVVLTHQVSSFIALTIVVAVIVGHRIIAPAVSGSPATGRSPFGGSMGVDLGAIFAVDLGLMTFMWSLTPYRGSTFLQTLSSLLVSTVTGNSGFLDLASKTTGGAAAGSGSNDLIKTIATYVDTAGFLLLLFATFLGCLYAFHRRRRSVRELALVVASATMVVFILGLPIFGIRTFVPGRWYAFAYAPMVLVGVLGLATVARRLGPRSRTVLLLAFIVAFPGVMLVSSSGTPDSPVFSSVNERLAYNQPELAAVHTLGQYTPADPGYTVYTDHPYETVVDRTGAAPATPATFANGSVERQPVYLYRTYQSDGASYYKNGKGGATLVNRPRSQLCGPGRDVVYANDQTELCVVPGGP